MSINNNSGKYTRLRRKNAKIVAISAQKERNLSIKKISVILQKDESKRTKEEKELLFNYSEIVREASLRIEHRKKLKDRLKEVEDTEVVLNDKCKKLAEAILKSEYLVVYTGAGISTAARIPDYRGTSGIWTLLQKGKDIGTHDLTQADPTYTHMALFQLYVQGKLKHIVSQNCDGLHLRSGLPKKALSEVHGNMYIEVCRSCRPIIEYLRIFDVTENTARYSHKTMRKCYKCNSSLVDSIVHFGERGNLPWPLNWKGACKAAEKADMILCIGSSLKVLKRYPWLWCMDKPAKRRPDVYIVNLQWTPKDCQAIIKINGKCDIVMEKLMNYLAITVPKYSRTLDPIFEHATDLCKEEQHTVNRPYLTNIKSESVDFNSEIKTENCSEDKCDVDNSVFDCIKSEKNFKKEEENELCVTTCKKEVFIDTGLGENVKYIKKELIVITIKSGEDFKDCCSLFKVNQSHDCDCPNFIDEQNDIPVIIEDDLLVVKNSMSSSLKIENVLSSDIDVSLQQNLEKSKSLMPVGNRNGNSNFAQSPYSNNDLSHNSPLKRTRDENEERKISKKSKNYDISLKEECNKSLGRLTDSLSVECKQMKKNGKSEGNKEEKESEKKGNSNCKYCWEQYLSNSCLFYIKRKPFFKQNVATCDCCSSGEDEDEAEDFDEKNNEMQKVLSVNPGWYGKGFRKNRKKR